MLCLPVSACGGGSRGEFLNGQRHGQGEGLFCSGVVYSGRYLSLVTVSGMDMV